MRLLKNTTGWLPTRISRGLRRVWRRSERALQPPLTFEQWAHLHNPLQGRVFADFTDFERETLEQVPGVIASFEARVTLLRSVEHVVRHRIPGALVECGVYTGGNIELMIRALQHLGDSDRDVYAYDTFAGMPRPGVLDNDAPDGSVKTLWEAHRTDEDGDAGSNWMKAPLVAVRQRIASLGYPDDRVHFVQGLVEETIPGVMPDRIAILRLDTDFYSSTKHELAHLYPRLSPGGVLIIDDYGAMPGCRVATDEYAAEHAISWFLQRVDAHVRLTIKP